MTTRAQSPVALAPMTREDFDSYVPYVVADYASRTAAAGVTSRDEALTRAHHEFSRLLPRGLDTPDNHLYMITVAGEASPIGRLWYALRGSVDSRYAMILNMEVDAAHRGRGYGKSVIRACAASALANGAKGLRINLLGEDTENRRLYESLGMSPMSILMNWDLTATEQHPGEGQAPLSAACPAPPRTPRTVTNGTAPAPRT
ncbi:GNAT family N-acetyltransferase [Streptomyces sp. NPDC008086]|uniref:GNAT family N-acetyltransferase n=1 Tax=Streptomyces sp. NPDC008086 TaxID=3364807 RepID=UPI0036E8CB92